MPFFIKIILRGHTMSFGGEMVSPKWRGTNDRPTMSFIVGFLCSCLGISFRKSLSEVKALRDALKVHTLVINRGRREMDFQTAGTNYNLEDPFEKMCCVNRKVDERITYGSSDVYKKELLVDAKFDVILEVENKDLSDKIVEALKNPQWFPFLGRKSNHISDMPFGGVYDDFKKAITGYKKGTLCIQHVVSGTENSESVKDYPMCEGDNRNTVRYVKEWLI